MDDKLSYFHQYVMRLTRELSWKISLWMMTDLKATYRIGTEDTNDFVNDKTFIMCK